MANDPFSPKSGLRLPLDVVQPFPLLFRRDDLHIMAVFGGHPDYEAVEAMIQYRAGGAFSIRAILTRHDQSQIDHVNDETLLTEMQGVQREVCHRTIFLKLESLSDKRRARLEFTSHAGEPIVLDMITVGRPDPKRGGLTDPGRHSPTSSLPVMWRGASTLAGQRTQVTIGGVSYPVPVKLRVFWFVALQGYYTERHSMGVIRAGTVTSRLLKRPDRLDVGAEWVFESGGRDVAYRVTTRAADGQIHIEKLDGSGEIITAHAVDGRLEVTRISLPGDVGSTDGLSLNFGGAAGFSLSMQGAQDLVTGRTEVAERPSGAIISLRPAQPSWAVDRPVRVDCERDGERMTFATSIGAALQAGS